MNLGYFIAAVVLYVASYIVAFVGNFVRFPVAMIVTTLGSMGLKLVAIILFIVGIYKAVKGSKFTNIEEEKKINE